MFDQYREMGSGGNEATAWKIIIVISILCACLLGGAIYAEHIGLPVVWHVPAPFAIVTENATDIGTNYATLNGSVTHLEDPSITVWFEYGSVKHNYPFRTDNQTLTVAGVFNQSVKGIQLFPGYIYFYRACGNTTGSNIQHYGEDLSFNLVSLTPIPDQDFDKHFEELEETRFNISKLASVIPKTYTDLMLESHLFFGLFWGILFLALWIRQEDITIPCFLGMIISASVFVLLPPEWMVTAQMLFVISFAGMIYMLLRGKR